MTVKFYLNNVIHHLGGFLMRYLSLFALCLLPSLLLARVNHQLPNRDLAYYGAEYYQALRSQQSLPKEMIHRILAGVHGLNAGSYDSINNCSQNCYRHQSVSYDEARRIIFGELDIERDTRGHYVKDVYCGRKVHFRSVDQVRNMHTEINIEHTWPQSKFTSRFSKGAQKSDMHHLYPTDSDANSRRGNHDFGEVGNAVDELNVNQCQISKLAVIRGEVIFMPPRDHRGNVARSLFYFAARYDMPIDAEDERVLRQWHELDPVDADERERHEIIARYQQVRNPFIDHPEIVRRIGNF